MEHPTARLMLVMGLPGSGKTYFAKALAAHIGATHYNSDRIRKEATQAVRYTDADKARVYEDLFARVTEALAQGGTVIVDATFSKAAYRQTYVQWTAAHKVPVHLLYMEAAEAVIAERVGKKRPDSDADFAVYQRSKPTTNPLRRTTKCCAPMKGAPPSGSRRPWRTCTNTRPDDPRTDPRADAYYPRRLSRREPCAYPPVRRVPAKSAGDLFYVICKHYDEFILGMRNSRHVPRGDVPPDMFMPVVHRAYPGRLLSSRAYFRLGAMHKVATSGSGRCYRSPFVGPVVPDAAHTRCTSLLRTALTTRIGFLPSARLRSKYWRSSPGSRTLTSADMCSKVLSDLSA
ncbi:MAG: ATP-binding protein [Flavobacteriales bacterium]|nr:ATP-binding protein [Flavobacteriales bacterium]